ncbi:TPA: hypothetical protein NGT30_004281 [Vibrio parahaemolyticus]|nr:hypothetical protein [Vibrio parahaemolyticus]HCE2311914.1 hypothetical protein [Vibrio parahaemolyticus]HCE4679202.1 hypothetical protein [Vibrio parahaemolyticus]HCG6384444.1 hypothetical protein [Vibrio parahaemolyticus]
MQEHLQKIYALRKRIVAIKEFDQADWISIGDITDCQHIIENHPRLLKALGFGDPDYPSAVADVLKSMFTYHRASLDDVIVFLDQNFPLSDRVSVSTAPTQSTKSIVFTPSIFQIPSSEVENDLVSIMMPFAGFDDVHQGLIRACQQAGYRCQRADDIWEHATILQDIFSLIYRSKIVIADFSGRNPNVMYEVGIAHTLGKIVIPISQTLEHIPSDLHGHRVQLYLKNGEGIDTLVSALASKLRNI